jgi:hypothetical protein
VAADVGLPTAVQVVAAILTAWVAVRWVRKQMRQSDDLLLRSRAIEVLRALERATTELLASGPREPGVQAWAEAHGRTVQELGHLPDVAFEVERLEVDVITLLDDQRLFYEDAYEAGLTENRVRLNAAYREIYGPIRERIRLRSWILGRWTGESAEQLIKKVLKSYFKKDPIRRVLLARALLAPVSTGVGNERRVVPDWSCVAQRHVYFAPFRSRTDPARPVEVVPLVSQRQA